MEDKSGFLEDLLEYFLLQIDKKNLLMILITLICYLIWLMAFPLFGPILNQYLESMKALTIEKGRIIEIYLLCMTISSLLSGFLIDRTSKRSLFIYISAFGVSMITFSFIFLNIVSLVFPVVALLGIIAGISPPAWGAFFTDYTVPQDRGRITGFIVAISMPCAFVFLVFGPLNIGGYDNAGLIIIGTISLASLLTLLLKPKDIQLDKQKTRKSRGAGSRQLFLYAFSFFLFYIVAGIMLSLVFPTLQDHIKPDKFYLLWNIPLFFSSIVAGIIIDNQGRKIPLIIGLTVTGISLGILGIIGIRSGFIPIITLAIGYSIVMVSSILIWADLAPMKSRGSYYGLGFSLIWFALLIGLTLSGSIKLHDISKILELKITFDSYSLLTLDLIISTNKKNNGIRTF